MEARRLTVKFATTDSTGELEDVDESSRVKSIVALEGVIGVNEREGMTSITRKSGYPISVLE